MKTLIEGASFLAVAVAAHVGGFALLTQGGTGAGGDGGAGRITLEGGGPGYAAMVAAWENPPELTPPPEALPEPLPEEVTDPLGMTGELPPLPRPETPGFAPLQAMTPPEAPADTLPDTAPPAPPVAWAPPPDPAPDLPEPSPAPDALPTLSTTPVPALSSLLAPMPEAPAPDATLPDTAPPPPLALAAPLERSPYPPARPEPRTDPRPPAAPSAAPAQRAAGSGAQGQAGLAAGTRQTSRAGVDTGGLVAQWGGAVRAAIQRAQHRPAHIRSSGAVVLRLEVHSEGRLLGVAVQQSSGHAALDQAALDAARRARIPAAPDGLSGTFQFNLPIRFRG